MGFTVTDGLPDEVKWVCVIFNEWPLSPLLPLLDCRFWEWHGDSGVVCQSMSLSTTPRAGQKLCHEVQVCESHCLLLTLFHTLQVSAHTQLEEGVCHNGCVNSWAMTKRCFVEPCWLLTAIIVLQSRWKFEFVFEEIPSMHWRIIESTRGYRDIHLWLSWGRGIKMIRIWHQTELCMWPGTSRPFTVSLWKTKPVWFKGVSSDRPAGSSEVVSVSSRQSTSVWTCALLVPLVWFITWKQLKAQCPWTNIRTRSQTGTFLSNFVDLPECLDTCSVLLLFFAWNVSLFLLSFLSLFYNFIPSVSYFLFSWIDMSFLCLSGLSLMFFNV